MSPRPLVRPAVRTASAALVLALGLALTGCGSDDPGADAPEDTTSASPEDGVVVEVTIEDGNVTPAGDRVEATVGEPVVMEITSDTAGELHVHSTPEQTVSFEEGTSTHEVVIDQPGVVEVESHDPDIVLVQLEVR